MAGVIEKKLSFMTLRVIVTKVGKDYQLLVEGGEAHIGCVVLAVPRPSLTGEDRISSTASVLNVTGHKDEEICRYLAERLAAEMNAVVACCGGIHVDHITEKQIRELREAVKTLPEEIINVL